VQWCCDWWSVCREAASAEAAGAFTLGRQRRAGTPRRNWARAFRLTRHPSLEPNLYHHLSHADKTFLIANPLVKVGCSLNGATSHSDC
jgi:hypothetical protein